MFLLLGLGGLAVVGRLIQLGIVEHNEWKDYAQTIQEMVVEIPSARGTICDRYGRPIAYDVPAYDIALDNFRVTKPEFLVELLCREFGMERNEAEAKVYRPAYFTWIARKVDRNVGERVKFSARDLGIRGLLFFDTWKRAYPEGPLALEVIGIVGVDGYGLEGLELVYDELLRGRPKRIRLLLGADGQAYDLVEEDPGSPGEDLRLTLDIDIQRICEQVLTQGLEEYRADRAFAIVMAPETGEILALAQAPRYDFDRSNPDLLHSWAVTDAFEPGSAFKALVGLAAVDLGLVAPDTIFSGDSPIVVAGVRINNASYRSYGMVDFRTATALSINTVFVQVAQRLGKDQVYSYLSRMGFGQPTGIELPGEATGVLRPLDKWTPVDLATAAFGQGVSVSGIQLAVAFSALANGGILYRPRLLFGDPVPKGRVASPEACATMRNILRDAVQQPGSTGYAAATPGFDVGGKSGTGEKAFPGLGYVSGRYMGVMATFFPVEKPSFLILAVYDEPKQKFWGGTTAGETVRRIIEGMAAARIVRPYADTTALGRSG